MDRKYSDHNGSPAAGRNPFNPRDPLVFVVSSDRAYMESVLAQCADVPQDYAVFPDIESLMRGLAARGRIGLAFAVIIEKSGRTVDAPALRLCKLEYPQLYYLLLLEECEQSSYLRFESIGIQSIVLPPFSDVSLTKEIATALPNVPQFKRHPDLMRRGLVRMDFLIPSDLSYVLGVNYLISMLLKEFSFPLTDCRINIPLACDEAITNAIIHGNKSDPEKKISIQIYVSGSRIKLRVKDQGEGFDVETVENPTQGKNLMRSSGRGVYLMKTIMDKVTYKEGGRVVELEKANSSNNSGSNAVAEAGGGRSS